MNKVNVYKKPKIIYTLNDFFKNIDQKLASQIPKSSKKIETYQQGECHNGLYAFIDKRFKRCIFLAKNKQKGVDDVSFNIIKNVLGCFANP